MALIIKTVPKRRVTVGLAAGIMIAATAVLGFSGAANADDHRWDHRGQHRGWNGGYYRSPPVVYYGQPQYYQPPVVYGPGLGLNFNIR